MTRGFFFVLAMTLALSAFAGQPPTPLKLDPAVQQYQARQAEVTPPSVLAWLKAGNARFASGVSEHGGYPIDARQRILVSSVGQRPLAAVLSCIDSRTTPELAFDTSVGDLFTARVGADVINDDILGSLEIAAESGVKVIVVLGHTQCGGVIAACNNVDLGHFTQLLARIKPAINLVNTKIDSDADYKRTVGEKSSTNRTYIAEVSHANARQSLAQIRERSPLLKAKADSGEILLVSAMFDVYTGHVTFDLEP